MKYFITLALLLVPFVAFGNEWSPYFSNLEKIKIAHSKPYSAYFHYNPESTIVLNELDRELSAKNGYEIINVAKIIIKRVFEETYLITYDESMSAEPSFKIYKLEGPGRKFIGGISTINLYWSRGRKFYTSGNLHSTYDQKRKYIIINDQIKEVQQPFMYVGLESELRKNIILYTSKEPTKRVQDEVGYLPAGAKITVLLKDNDYYLIKTSFGLVGWVKIEKDAEDTIMDGLYDKDRQE